MRNAVDSELLTTVRRLEYDVQQQCGIVRIDKHCRTDIMRIFTA